MQLLDAQQVKTEKDRAESERIERIRKLNEEESSLVKKVNDTRAKTNDQIKAIDAELADYRKNADSAKALIDQELSVKKTEVLKLEERKAESLKPINELRNETDRRFAEADQRDRELAGRENDLREGQRTLSNRLEKVIDREDAVAEKEQDLNNREKAIVASEQKTKESSEKLASEWVKFHKDIHDANADLAIREKHAQDGIKANESIRTSNEAESARLKEEDRAIKDKYAALAQAKVHLGIKD